MSGGSRIVGAAELAEWLDLTPRRVQQLVKEGVIPKEGRGEYPLQACVLAYIKFQDDQIERTGASTELSEEKLLSARLDRRRRELEFAQMEGRLITVEHHERLLAEAFSLVRSNIRNLPGALAPRLAGLDDPREIQGILVPAVDDALRSIVEQGERLGDKELPEDLPGRSALVEGGVTSISELMSIPDLTAIKGIGAATAEKIRAWTEGL